MKANELAVAAVGTVVVAVEKAVGIAGTLDCIGTVGFIALLLL